MTPQQQHQTSDAEQQTIIRLAELLSSPQRQPQ